MTMTPVPPTARLFDAADFAGVVPLDPPRPCPRCRQHPGVTYLVSGAPVGCARFVPSSRDARRQREYADRINLLVKAMQSRAAERGFRCGHGARLGMGALSEMEPDRLPALYAALANGRDDEVIDHLIEYLAANREKWAGHH